MDFKRKSDKWQATYHSLRITSVYLMLGVLWIVFSDYLLGKIISDPSRYAATQTYKGTVYVILTAIVIFLEMRRIMIKESRFNHAIQDNSQKLKRLSDELQVQVNEMTEARRVVNRQDYMIDEMLKEVNTPIVMWRLDGSVIRCNLECERLMNANAEQGAWNSWDELATGGDMGMKDRLSRILSETKLTNFETLIGDRLISWNDKMLEMEGEEAYIVSIGRDITEIRKEEEQVRILAEYDSLTGLHNRNRLNQDLKDLQTKDLNFDLLYVDIDDFKVVNHIYGHQTGDLVLVAVSRILKEVFETEYIYRCSGDEFIIIDMPDDEAGLTSQLERLHDKFKKKISAANHRIRLGVSIGIANYPEHGADMDELLRNAYLAIQMAKRSGKSKSVRFQPQMLEEMACRLNILRKLDEAILNNELSLVIQPIYRLEDRETVSVEMLLRWESMSESISTGEIIKIAEESDRIVKIDRWVIINVMRMIQIYQEEFKGLTVSVNLSAKAFRTNDFISYLKKMAEEFKIDPAQIQLEITEHSIVDNFEDALMRMRELKEMGFTLVMDDFGTRYSSLNYLSQLPFDILKIDREYIGKALDDEATYRIVQTIVKLAHDLGLKTVGEGVETVEQEKMIRVSGCEMAQGYYYAHPMKVDEFMKSRGS